MSIGFLRAMPASKVKELRKLRMRVANGEELNRLERLELNHLSLWEEEERSATLYRQRRAEKRHVEKEIAEAVR